MSNSAVSWTAAHQAPPFLGFSRQEHWSGLPFPFPMHESEKWNWSHSVVSDSSKPHGLWPTRLLRPWDFPGKSTGVSFHCLLQLVCSLAWSTQFLIYSVLDLLISWYSSKSPLCPGLSFLFLWWFPSANRLTIMWPLIKNPSFGDTSCFCCFYFIFAYYRLLQSCS